MPQADLGMDSTTQHRHRSSDKGDRLCDALPAEWKYILLALYIVLQCAEDNHLVLSRRGNSVARFFSLCYHDIAIWLSSCVRRVRCWNALSIPFFRHPRCSIRFLVILAAAAAAKIPPFKPHGTRHKERTECEFLPVRMAEADSPS